LIKFLLLTGARRSEAVKMPWGEVDGSTWLLPANRNKVKVAFIRPLSPAARAVLDALPRINGCPYAFTTNGSKAMASLGKRKRGFESMPHPDVGGPPGDEVALPFRYQFGGLHTLVPAFHRSREKERRTAFFNFAGQRRGRDRNKAAAGFAVAKWLETAGLAGPTR
jgi:integrase